MSQPQPARRKDGRTSRWNVPNVLCVIRLIGAVILVLLAVAGLRYWFLGLYVVLGITDLIDGPLARWLKQQSELGAWLDTIADSALSVSLLVGLLWLCWDQIAGELPWILAVIVAYLIGATICWSRFGKLPTFHTWAAKVSHFLVAMAGLCLLLEISEWPLRIAIAGTLLTNLEIIAIAVRLPEWRSDVPSVFKVSPAKPAPD